MKIRWKSVPSPGKGKAKENPARARRVARTEKKATQVKVTVKRQQSTRASRVSVETVESTDKELLTVGTSSRPNLKAKARSQGCLFSCGKNATNFSCAMFPVSPQRLATPTHLEKHPCAMYTAHSVLPVAVPVQNPSQ